jgi:hypothetical protein
MISRDNVVSVAIGTITVTVIGTLVSDVFSPVSENIRHAFSPSGYNHPNAYDF